MGQDEWIGLIGGKDNAFDIYYHINCYLDYNNALGEMFMKLFSQEPEVIQAGIEFLKRVLPFYSILGASFILNGALRGAGESFVPMIGSLVAMWLARVPTAYALAHFFGGHNLYFSYPIGWLIGLIIAGTYYLKGPWKEKAISRAKRQRAA